MKEGKHTRNWELIVAGGICIVISLLHLLGVFEQRWLLERISTITLLVLGLFIAFLTRVLERIDYRQDMVDLKAITDIRGNLSEANQAHISSNINDIKSMMGALLARESMAGVDIKQFKNVGDVYDYVSSKLRAARNGVKDITWGSYTGYRTEHEQKCYRELPKHD